MSQDLIIFLQSVGFFAALMGCGWLIHKNVKLTRRLYDLESDRNILHTAVVTARDTFGRYALMHRVKDTPEGDKKAHDNKVLQQTMNNALLDTEYEEPSIVQKIVAGLRQQMSNAGITVNG